MRCCRLWHRWGKWETEYIECPKGEAETVEVRSRGCKRCPMIEEDYPVCVSLSPEVARGLIP